VQRVEAEAAAAGVADGVREEVVEVDDHRPEHEAERPQPAWRECEAREAERREDVQDEVEGEAHYFSR
jgi:hypothetical protein